VSQFLKNPVYIDYRKTKRPPKFRKKSKAGLYKGEDLTVPIWKLRENWVPGTQAIYIGKAGSSTTEQGLKKRLHKLVYTGFVPNAQRKGGRLIWQLADAEDLILCWKTNLGEEPADYEWRLITAFERKFGKKPFANLI
jgi:hypothetical protein